MENYQCEKCGLPRQATKIPADTSCPSGGNHHWVTLGEVGDTKYECAKCKLVVQSKDIPLATRCPTSGEEEMHEWVQV